MDHGDCPPHGALLSILCFEVNPSKSTLFLIKVLHPNFLYCASMKVCSILVGKEEFSKRKHLNPNFKYLFFFACLCLLSRESCWEIYIEMHWECLKIWLVEIGTSFAFV